MKEIIISTEVISIIFTMIFLYSVLFEDKRKNIKKSIFCVLSVCVIITLVMDICSWVIQDYPRQKLALTLLVVGLLIMSGVVTTAFAYYILVHLNSLHYKSYWYAHIVGFINFIGTIIVIMSSMKDKVYIIENGMFKYGAVFYYVEYSTIAVLLYLFIFIILNRKYFGFHDTIAFLIYLIIPFIATVIEGIWCDYAFAYVSSAVSLAIVFVMLQSREIIESRMREKVLNKVSNVDPLTGLNNRRAYDSFVLSLDGEDGMGAIFCDLNELKYTNDNFGHAEGDKMICNFAKMLKEYFETDRIFRISGDEFIILLSDLTEEVFNERVKEFYEVLTCHSHISSIGSAYGQKKSARQLIATAEEAMYMDKEYYYYQCGRERRQS